MNIVDKYIELRKQLVILISGLSGTGISHLAKHISKDFKIVSLSYAKFCNPEFKPTIKLPDGTEVLSWDDDDNTDWAKLNKALSDLKGKGVIAFAPAFPTDKLSADLEVDTHIHIRMSKQNLIARRQRYMQDHKEECKELLDRPNEALIFNKYTFPYYLKSVERSKITKFINANEFSSEPEAIYDENVYEEAFSYLINHIGRWLDKYNETKVGRKLLEDERHTPQKEKMARAEREEAKISNAMDSDEEDLEIDEDSIDDADDLKYMEEDEADEDELEDEGFSVLYK